MPISTVLKILKYVQRCCVYVVLNYILVGCPWKRKRTTKQAIAMLIVIHLQCDNSHSLQSSRYVMAKTFCPGNEQKIHRQTDTRRRREGGWEKICASSFIRAKLHEKQREKIPNRYTTVS